MNISSGVNINMAAPVYSEIANTANAESAARAKANVLPPVEAAKESAKALNRDNPNQRAASQHTQNEATKTQAKQKAISERGSKDQNSANKEANQEKPSKVAEAVNGVSASGQALSEQQLAEIKILAARDTEVRAHERAHAVAGGALAGSPSYSYERGPNGRRYAVGGEVSIDVSPVPGNPEATIRKMEQVRQAALAPSEPSAQDRKVAAVATQTIAQARVEVLKANDEKVNSGEPAEKTASAQKSSAGSEVADKNRDRIQRAQDGEQIKSGNMLAIEV